MKPSDVNLPSDEIKQKYQLLAKIGSGGMGDVFLCVQRGAVDFSRLVVLKAINNRHTQYSDEHARMFVNEARVVASLNHPHIVKIHDFCMTDASIYIVMEYVEGETLRYICSVCQRRSQYIPKELLFRLILDACDALHYAHNAMSPTGEKRETIHRDIGLHNLMLDSNGYLKIIDFGIAKSSVQTDRTSPGLIKGNPAYMAPDLFNKTSPDHRIDIYALGLCLYELLTLTRAFKFHKSATVGQIIQEISTKELIPPSRIVPDLPKELDDIVLKAVEKERDNRYQTIQAFANDLRRVAKPFLTSEFDAKQWFQENFSDRLRERREFGARMLMLAENTDTSFDSMGLPGRMPTGLVSINSITPSAHTVNPTSQLVLTPTSLYKIMGALFLLFVACVGVVYLFFFREPAPSKNAPVTDNLVVSCNPEGSTLSIDGNELGMLENESLSLHVEPNQKHELILSKTGYQDYTLPFVGPATGMKRVDATLKKIEPEQIDTAVEEVRDEATEPSEMMFTDSKKHTPRYQRKKTGRKSSTAIPQNTPESMDKLESDKSVSVESSKSSSKSLRSLPEERRRMPLIDDEDKKVIPLVDD